MRRRQLTPRRIEESHEAHRVLLDFGGGNEIVSGVDAGSRKWIWSVVGLDHFRHFGECIGARVHGDKAAILF